MINILILSIDNDGVGSWRLLTPHSCINEPDINIDIRYMNDHTLPLLNEQFLSNYQIIVYNKKVPFLEEKYQEIFDDILKRNNIKRVLDIDDYWMLDSSHINYHLWKQSNGKQSTIEELKKADYVITTTSIFEKDILEHNKNVVVLPNAVNQHELQWTSNKKQSDKVRFIWGGGITHVPDLRLLTDSFKAFDKDFIQNTQLYLCGFDLRLKTDKGVAKSDWKNSPWTIMEDIFTNNFKYVTNPEHYSWLRQCDDGGKDTYGVNEKFINEFYQRRWTKPILLYGTMYNEADVALAPLKSNLVFNLRKSQLKIIEAGVHKCPIIASNFGPYTIDDIEGKTDGKPKGFLIDENDRLGWYEKMKWFKNNPNAIKEYGDNLYNYIIENYSMDVVNKKRIEFYRSIVK